MVGTRTSIALACAFALVLGLSAPAGALPVAAADYPTWDEVQAARGDTAATAATISQLEQGLDALEQEAAELGDVAVARSSEAATTAAELAQATALVDALGAQAEEAAERAELSTAQAASIVAAMYRSGDVSTLSLMSMSSDDSESLLSRLATLEKVSERTQRTLTAAISDRNLVSSLAEQATAAQDERLRLDAIASSALEAARAAEQTADDAVAQQQASLMQLYEQLAMLRNTSVQTERDYRVGQQAAAAPGAGSPGTGSSGGSPGTTPGGTPPVTTPPVTSPPVTTPPVTTPPVTSPPVVTPPVVTPPVVTPPADAGIPGNEVNDPQGAKDYAAARLAEMGLGADQFQCLVLLWNRESGWRTNAHNPSSGAYGIPQSWPGSKMATWGADWRTNYRTQIGWGLSYISVRYGDPCAAWAHSEEIGWY